MYAAELDAAVIIDAPAEQVWADLTRWEEQERWMLATRVRRRSPAYARFAAGHAAAVDSAVGSTGGGAHPGERPLGAAADGAAGSTHQAAWADGGPTGVGSWLIARTGCGPLKFTDTMVITGWDPPRRCDVVHLGLLLRGDGGFAVDALGSNRCRVRWWERVRLPGPAGPARLGWRLVRPFVDAGIRRSLRVFASWTRQQGTARRPRPVQEAPMGAAATAGQGRRQ